MSLLKADTIKPVTSSGDLSLQGDSGGSAVDCLNITSAGDINFTGNTDAKIKLPSAGGLYESDGSTAILTESGGAVTLDNVSMGSSVVGASVKVAVVCGQTANGVYEGAFTSGAWQTRAINTELADPDSIVTISSNQFSVGAGTYVFDWLAPAHNVNYHRAVLYDVTGTAYLSGAYGYVAYNQAGVTGVSTGTYVHAPSGTNLYEIRHACQTTNSGNDGFGAVTGAATQITGTPSGIPEVYTIVKITKLK